MQLYTPHYQSEQGGEVSEASEAGESSSVTQNRFFWGN